MIDTSTPPLQIQNAPLWRAAQKMETAFLTEMLKYTGLGETGGEPSPFLSFMQEAQAEALVQAGGVGLSESLFHAMAEKADG